MSEIELNLRLDSNCRTTTSFDPTNNNHNEQNNDQSSSIQSSIEIDYSSKTVFTSLPITTNIPTQSKTFTTSTASSSSSSEKYNKTLLDDILYDCEITDCALLPRTFWIPCTNFKPRCILEQCALEIFYHHVRKRRCGGGDEGDDDDDEKRIFYDPNTSGAEWWVQIRPSPKSGRYKMLVQDERNANEHSATTTTSSSSSPTKTNSKVQSNNNNKEDESDKGICFHWDKDEDLRLLMGGKMYIHPHISTVTYLTDIGPPTMALNYRVNALTGEYIIPTKRNEKDYGGEDDTNNNDNASDNTSHVVEGYISWPKKGKHLSFDGRYLHAAPADLMKKGLFEEQIEIPIEVSDDDNTDHLQKEQKKRRHRRVTFLVNIWLNYKPFNVDVFPETMIGMLSKADPYVATHILFKNDDESGEEENKQCTVKNHIYDKMQSLEKYTKFEWSMGNSDSSDKEEMISMSLPIDLIQNELGGNIKISWPYQKNADEIGIQLSTNATNCDQDSQLHETKKQRVE